MALTGLRGQTAHENPQIELPALGQLEINGVRPFGSHIDDAQDRLDEVHALLSLLRGAYVVCEEAGEPDSQSFMDIRPMVKARALEGIATLIALAQHHMACADVEARQQEGGRHV